MDLSIIYTKTSKGTRALSMKSKALSAKQVQVLSKINGKLDAKSVMQQAGKLSDYDFTQIIIQLIRDELIVESSGFSETEFFASHTINPMIVEEVNTQEFFHSEATDNTPAANTPPAQKSKEETAIAGKARAEAALDNEEESIALVKAAIQARLAAEAKAEGLAKIEARVKAEIEAEAKAKAEAEAKAKAEVEAKAKAEAERVRLEAEALAKAEAERARLEAEAQAKAEAERLRLEAEAQAKAEAERVRAEAEAQAKAEAERVRAKAEAQAKAEAEAQAKAEAERARLEAEAQAKVEEERARAEAEALAKAEAERLRLEAEALAKAEAERIKAEAEALAKAEAERLRLEVEALAKAEAERARLEAEAQAKAEAERVRAKAEAQAKAEAEAQAKAEAERARLEAEAQAKVEEERARAEAEALAKAEAERLRLEAEALAKAEAERVKAVAKEKTKPKTKKSAKQAGADQAEKIEPVIAFHATEWDIKDFEPDADKRKQEEDSYLAAEQADAAFMQQQTSEPAYTSKPKSTAKPYKSSVLSNLQLPKQLRLLPLYCISLISRLTLPLAIGGGVVVILAVLLTALPIFMTPLIAPIEKIASQVMGEQVTVQQLHSAWLPTPHLVLENVSIGTASDIKLSTVHITPALFTLLDEVKVVHNISLQGATLNPAQLARSLQWLSASKQQTAVVLEAIQLKDINIQLDSITTPKFDGKIEVNAQGALQLASLRTSNKQATVQMKALADSGYQVEVQADQLTLPTPPASSAQPLQLSQLVASGVMQPNKLVFNTVEANVYGGALKAQVTVDWQSQWSAKADFQLDQADVETSLAQFTQVAKGKGLLSANGKLTSRASALEQLLAAPQIQAQFNVARGELQWIDLLRAIQSGKKQGSIGGTTRFDTLSGRLSAHNDAYQFQDLTLKAGNSVAKGNLLIQANETLSGKLQVNMGTPARQIKSTIVLSGKASSPSSK